MSVLDAYSNEFRKPAARPIRTAIFIGTLTEDESTRGLVEVDYAGAQLRLPALPGKYIPGGLVYVDVDDSGRPRRVTGAASDKAVGDKSLERAGFTPTTETVTVHKTLLPQDLTADEKAVLEAFPGEMEAANARLEAARTELEQAGKATVARVDKLESEVRASDTNVSYKLSTFATNIADVQVLASQAKAAAARAENVATNVQAAVPKHVNAVAEAVFSRSSMFVRSSTAPTEMENRTLWFNTTDGLPYIYDGEAKKWVVLENSAVQAATAKADEVANLAATAKESASAANNLATQAKQLSETAKTDADKANAAAVAAQSKAESATAQAVSALAEAQAAKTLGQDAARDVTAAKDKADRAAADALSAKNTADTLTGQMSTAQGLITLAYRNPNTSDGAGKKDGSLWYVFSGSTPMRAYVWRNSAWQAMKLGPEFIGNNAITRAHIASAAIGSAQIADASITNAKLGKLSVAYANLQKGIAEELWTNDLVAKAADLGRVTVAGGNLVWNGAGAYKEDLDGWEYSATVPPTDGVKGTWWKNNPTTLWVRDIPVQAGNQYRWNWWVEWGSSSSSFNTAVVWRDANGRQISYTYVGGTHRKNAANWWEKRGIDLTAPDRAATVSLQWRDFTGGTTWRVGGIELLAKTGATLIQDGAVTTQHLTAGAVTSDKITANAITGKTFLGSKFYAASNTGTWDNTVMDATGLHVYKQGKEQVRISADVETGLAVRSPVRDEMIPLGHHVFGREFWAEGEAKGLSWHWQFHDFERKFTPLTAANLVGYTSMVSGDRYRVIMAVYFKDSQTGQKLDVGLAHSVGIYATTIQQPITLVPGREYTVGMQFRVTHMIPGTARQHDVGEPIVSPRIVWIEPLFGFAYRNGKWVKGKR
ncbi:hypothetical protein ACU19_04955 [Actinobaculum suis]|uniref:hypothetical protein n=1 Tax=Actinobaculum suis TaxID=1657 RepID=UPI00066FE070|nr:hypothetical protein [Actinobaculum suis]KMY23323.1 hypothetical protein ACU19_04955 [Actinobaculum suis]